MSELLVNTLSGAATLGQSAIDWWLGLDRVQTGEGGELSIGWQYPLPLWAWAAILLGAVLLAGWSYHRLIGRRWARLSLAGVRAAVLVFIAVLLAGPLLVRITEQVESDRLLMLVDRSASMQVQDLTDGQGQPLSRDAAMSRALAAQGGVFTDEAMTREREVRWFGFGGDAFDMPAPGSDSGELPEPDKQATRLRSAIEQAVSRAAGHPIAGIVLLTDGRSPQTTGPELTNKLGQVPVFSVPVGADELPMDLALTEVQAPERAFADDLVPVTATVEQLGGAPEALPETITVRLVDAATGEVADTRQISRDRLG
jgi:hypothetical protein